MAAVKERARKKEKPHTHKNGPASCPIVRLLDQKLQEEVANAEHLMDYIHDLDIETIGIPDYHPVLDPKAGDMKDQALFMIVITQPGEAAVMKVSANCVSSASSAASNASHSARTPPSSGS